MEQTHSWNLKQVVENNPIQDDQKLTRTFLADGKYGTALVVQAQPQEKPFIHTHEHHDEFIYVIEGEGKAYVGDKEYDVKSGDLVYGPAGVAHGFFMPVKGIRLSFYGPKFDQQNPDRVVASGEDLK